MISMLTLIFGMSELVSLIFDMVYSIGISYNTKKNTTVLWWPLIPVCQEHKHGCSVSLFAKSPKLPDKFGGNLRLNSATRYFNLRCQISWVE